MWELGSCPGIMGGYWWLCENGVTADAMASAVVSTASWSALTVLRRRAGVMLGSPKVAFYVSRLLVRCACRSIQMTPHNLHRVGQHEGNLSGVEGGHAQIAQLG